MRLQELKQVRQEHRDFPQIKVSWERGCGLVERRGILSFPPVSATSLLCGFEHVI